MSVAHHHVLIMAGGIGSRFWPMSTQDFPKQFIDIFGNGLSLLQETYRRLSRLVPEQNIWVITHKQYATLCKTQLPKLAENRLLLEPSRRNTAPCIAYGLNRIMKEDADATILVSPSDHLIIDEDRFIARMQDSFCFAESNPAIVTIGLKPNAPNTGYGYIQFLAERDETTVGKVYKVKTFTEKPNRELAQSFLQSGDFLWNSGIMTFKGTVMQEAMQKHLPSIFHLFHDQPEVYDSPQEGAFLESVYSMSTSISIDYGVMEKATNVYVIYSDFGWSDLGSWGSLYENMQQDLNGNAYASKNVMFYDTKRCLVHGPQGKLIVLQGLEDHIVVDTQHVLLICQRDKEQEIKQIVMDVKVEKGERFI